MSSPRSWRPWAVGLVLVLAALAAHLPAVENDFVTLDDPDYVREVPEVMGGLRPANVLWAFTSVEAANWFPVTRLSWMLDAQLFGRDPAGFHATSVVLHVLNVALLFAALFRLTRDLWPSAFVAAVFAVHPLHVESVAWVSTRKDVLSGLFFAVSLLLYERQVRGERPRAWSAALFGTYALGLMSKPVLVTLPFLLLLLDVWPLARWRRGEVAGLFREKAPLFVLTLLMCGVVLIAQQDAMPSSERFSLSLRIQNAILAYFEYLERAVWPMDLMVLYPVTRLGGDRLVWSAVGLVAGTLLALRSLRSRPWFFVGWFWYTGLLIPTIGILQVGNQATADRYTYLPLAGVSILVAWGIRDGLAWLGPVPRRAVAGVLGAGVVVWLALLIGVAREQVAIWKDGRTLWLHAAAIAPESYGVRFRTALALHDAGDYAAAIPHYEVALELAPGHDELRVALERARRGKRRAGR